VSIRLRPWLLSVFLLGFCGLVVAILEWRRQSVDITDFGLFLRLPFQADGVQLFMNVRALREAGLLDLLAGSKAAEETDYRDFVEATGFDYREDLDAVLASFRDGRSAFVLRGRFDWEQIRRYCLSQGAKCVNGYCDMETKHPRRYISLFMVHPRVLAIGVSIDTYLAYSMKQVRAAPPGFQFPPQPFWVSLSGPVLEKTESLPPGTRAFVSAAKGADRVTLGVSATNDKLEAELRASFPAPAQAIEMKKQMETSTGMLRKFFARDNQAPDPNDLSGILTSGTFEQRDQVAVGRWPIQWAFLRSLSEGNPLTR
jgi:hypothetical protein